MKALDANALTSAKTLLTELDSLKTVYRKSVISDSSRYENSAEHSWHVAVAFLAFEPFLPDNFNTLHAIKLALTHDICEIGAGDSFVYDSTDGVADREEKYLKLLACRHPEFGLSVHKMWLEYEAQETIESRWVKVIDKLLPFILNIITEGRTWQERQITSDRVMKNIRQIQSISPVIYEWMMAELKKAIRKGWIS